MTIVALAGTALATAAPAGATFGGDNAEVAFTVGGSGSIHMSDGAGGAGLLLLGPGAHDDASWSPDGTRIAYTRAEPTGAKIIWVADAAGQNAQPIIAGEDPSWSPDGTRLAFVTKQFDAKFDVATVAVANPADVKRVSLSYGFDDRDPVYSPSGTRIMYASLRDEVTQYPSGNISNDSWNIYAAPMYSDGTFGNDSRLIGAAVEGDPDQTNPEFSPDGTRITFAQRAKTPGAVSQVVVANADGALPQVVVDGADPVFSPDGLRIAYASGPAIRAIDLDDHQVADMAVVAGDMLVRPSWRTTNPTPWAPQMTPVFGESLKIQDNVDPERRYFKVDMTSPAISTLGDALQQGSATLRVNIDGVEYSHDLPLGNWLTIVRREELKRYRYVDMKLEDGPIKSVVIDMVRGRLILTGKDGQLFRRTDAAGNVLPVLSTAAAPSLVTVEFVAGEVGFCAAFGGETRWSVPRSPTGTRTLTAKDAPSPAAC